MGRRNWIGGLACIAIACQSGTDGPGKTTVEPTGSPPTATTTWQDPPLTTATPTPTDVLMLNPERGFYRYVDLVTASDLSYVRDEGYTLAFSYVRLDDWRTEPLPQSLLDQIGAGFAVARNDGVKVVLRFAYNFGPWPDSAPDASKAQVLAHIDQLTPALQANADVIAVVQAGFIGAWGEWHTSTEGLLDDPATKFEILEALVDAVPAERSVQLRYPPYKDEGYGGPLDAGVAHTGTYAARVGHHNDCFLASDTDFGTYPYGERETWLAWLEQENRYVPMGGETCNVYPPLTDCSPALAELERLRFTYINRDYHPDVVSGWVGQGCDDEIKRKLGYRLALSEVQWPQAVRPGGVIPLIVTLNNEGWAAPINPRPVQVVLVGPQTLSVDLGLDVRTWLVGEHTVDVRLQLPADLAEGTWELGLALPDSDLGTDPRYAIQLANDGTWREGWNALGTVEVSADAPGSSDPTATAFVVHPGL